jgi:hypothetical protein
MNNKFSEIPYFIINDYLTDTTKHTSVDKYTIDYKWDVVFVDTIIESGETTYTDGDIDITENREGCFFVNFNDASFGINYSYTQPDIVDSYMITSKSLICVDDNLGIYIEDDKYLPIDLKLRSIKDNRFNFYDNTSILVSSGTINAEVSSSGHHFIEYDYDVLTNDTNITNNKSIYFRNDSSFVEWLKNSASEYYTNKYGYSFDIRRFVNYDQNFIYIGDLFTTRNDIRLIYYGLKDWILNAIPEHQRTPKFTEFLDTFFDKLYIENYNSLKDIINFNDPFLVPIEYLGYISKMYDMFDIDSFDIPEYNKRVLISNMIDILKRKGTYSDIYILWNVISNSKNYLNIYERWHTKYTNRWIDWPESIDQFNTDTWPNYPLYSDTQGKTNVPDNAWYDVNYLYRPEYEFPMITDGAGEYYYNTKYPVFPEDMDYNLYYSTDSSYIHYQSLPSTEWIIHHNLDDKIHLRVVTKDFVEKKPTTIKYIDDNTLQLTFNKPNDGIVIIEKAEKYFIQEESIDDTFYINHNLHTKQIITNFVNDYTSTEPISVSIVDDNNIIASFNSLNTKKRICNVSKADYTSDIVLNSTEWIITHNLGMDAIIVNVFDENGVMIYDYDTTIIDDNNVSVKFNTPTSGYITILNIGNKTSNTLVSGGYIYEQSITSNEWIINHNLESNVHIQVYDENNEKINDCEIGYFDTDSFKITFNDYKCGYVYIRSADKSIYQIDTYDGYLYQTIVPYVWDIKHLSNHIVLSDFRKNTDEIQEGFNDIIDKNNIRSLFNYKVDYNKRSCAMSSNVEVIYHDNESTRWDIKHHQDTNLVITQVYNENNERIYPSDIIINGVNNIILTFNVPRKGYCVVLRNKNIDYDVSGMLLTPHYLIELDINNEPMGKNAILDKDIWNSVYSYWEYLRPVHRVTDYKVVLSPIVDFTGNWVSLYDTTNAFLLSRNISLYDNENDSYTHKQITLSNKWTIHHNLNSDVHIRVYDENDYEIIPKSITIIDSNIIKLTFDDQVIGHAYVKRIDRKDCYNTLSKQVYDTTIEHKKQLIVSSFYENDDMVMQSTEQVVNDSLAIATFDYYDIERKALLSVSDNMLYQDVKSNVWSFMNKTGYDSLILHIYDNNGNRIYPENTIITPNIITVEFNHLVSGYITILNIGNRTSNIIVSGGYIHEQSMINDEWTVTHNLNNDVHVQVYDENDYEIIPKSITIIDPNTIKLTFDDQVMGNAYVKQTDYIDIHAIGDNSIIWVKSYDINKSIVNFYEDNYKVYEYDLMLDYNNTFVAHFNNDYIRERSYSLIKVDNVYYQSIPDDEWNISHNLNDIDIMIDCYDIFDNKIIPQSITIVDSNNIKLTFDDQVIGYCVIKPSDSNTFIHYQSCENIISYIDHNLDSDVVIQIYDIDYNVMIPKSIEILNKNSIKVVFDKKTSYMAVINKADISDNQYKVIGDINDINVNNHQWSIILNEDKSFVDFTDDNVYINESELIMVNDGFIANFNESSEVFNRCYLASEPSIIIHQNEYSTEWISLHNLKSKGVLCMVFDENGKRISPMKTQMININTCIFTFNEPKKGYVVYLRTDNDNYDNINMNDYSFRLYENIGDINNNVMELYKDKFDYFNETINGYYLQRDIPKDVDSFIFNEIGIYDENDNLMFYTKCSDVYKPDDTIFTLHYRINK